MPDQLLDLRKLRQDTAAAPVAPVAQTPLVGPELAIQVRYVAPDGTVHEDALVSKVLTLDGRAQAGRIQAHLAGGQDYDKMPAEWRAWAAAVAVCTVQVDKPPDWFTKWAPLDDALLYSVANKLWEHNDIFFRAGAFASASDAPARVVVHAAELDRAVAAAAEQK